MSQMWVEGTLGIVPELAPKIMLNEEGENITLSDNKAMFTRWANSESIANMLCFGQILPYDQILCLHSSLRRYINSMEG